MSYWSGKWFEVRAALGESDMIRMRYRDEHKGDWIKADFPHREGDGYGRILRILRGQGIVLNPVSRPLKPPPAWKALYLLIKGGLCYPQPKNPWISFDPKRPVIGEDGISREHSVEDGRTIIWSREETAEHREFAKKSGLSPAFSILNQVSTWLRENLVKKDGDLTWLCPVDLRGAYPDASDENLVVSMVPVQFKPGSIATDLYAEYKKSLKRGDYWAYWEAAQVGKWVGLDGMKKIAIKAAKKSFWAGSFSDLGSWNDQKLWDNGLQDREWSISTPGSPNYPVGVVLFEWCGRQIITIKVHPAITDRPVRETADEILRYLLTFRNP